MSVGQTQGAAGSPKTDRLEETTKPVSPRMQKTEAPPLSMEARQKEVAQAGKQLPAKTKVVYSASALGAQRERNRVEATKPLRVYTVEEIATAKEKFTSEDWNKINSLVKLASSNESVGGRNAAHQSIDKLLSNSNEHDRIMGIVIEREVEDKLVRQAIRNPGSQASKEAMDMADPLKMGAGSDLAYQRGLRIQQRVQDNTILMGLRKSPQDQGAKKQFSQMLNSSDSVLKARAGIINQHLMSSNERELI